MVKTAFVITVNNYRGRDFRIDFWRDALNPDHVVNARVFEITSYTARFGSSYRIKFKKLFDEPDLNTTEFQSGYEMAVDVLQRYFDGLDAIEEDRETDGIFWGK